MTHGNTLNDQIVAYLRVQDGGADSLELAGRFLKFKNPPPVVAHAAVKGILDKDRRCRLSADGRWCVVSAAETEPSLRQAPWAAIFVLNHGVQVRHVSAWSVYPAVQPLLSAWFTDPAALPSDEQELLRDPADAPFAAAASEELAGLVAGLCRDRVALFLSSQQQSILSRHLTLCGESLTDDTLVVPRLFGGAGLAVPRPLDIQSCHHALFSTAPRCVSAASRGEALAQCAAELVDRLAMAGLGTRGQLQQAEEAEIAAFDFTGKQFDAQTLAALPRQPGVYGFKDRDGRYIYIGKATSLRQRVGGYFRKSDESPAKLERLRSDSASLVTYPCGSELESLLYEHRLIRKYAPALNTQFEINERKGQWRPVPDSIVLLPHAESGKGMSLWFRKNQKISMRPFQADFSDSDGLADELERFFFGGTLPAEPTDFPEQEIASRWIKRHSDDLLIVPVDRCVSGKEVLDAMAAYWKDGK